MKSHLFLAQCLSHPWAMTPDAMRLFAAMLSRGYARRNGVSGAIGHEMEERSEPQAASPKATPSRQGSIAVIKVFGPIMQRASQFGPCEGGTGTDQISSALSAAMADETVSQVLMVFDTPGGSVFGVDELASQIRSERTKKPIIGISDSLCASAGYYLMSQCSEAYCTPGGQVGSIGVYMAHEDVSKALEAAGVNVTLISAGKYKTEGNPFAPLDSEALANQQASVDGYYAAFTGAVAKGRGVPVDQVRTGMGEGRCLSASQALQANMIDGVMSLPEVIKKMQRAASASRRPALASARATLATV